MEVAPPSKRVRGDGSEKSASTMPVYVALRAAGKHVGAVPKVGDVVVRDAPEFFHVEPGVAPGTVSLRVKGGLLHASSDKWRVTCRGAKAGEPPHATDVFTVALSYGEVALTSSFGRRLVVADGMVVQGEDGGSPTWFTPVFHCQVLSLLFEAGRGVPTSAVPELPTTSRPATEPVDAAALTALGLHRHVFEGAVSAGTRGGVVQASQGDGPQVAVKVMQWDDRVAAELRALRAVCSRAADPAAAAAGAGDGSAAHPGSTHIAGVHSWHLDRSVATIVMELVAKPDGSPLPALASLLKSAAGWQPAVRVTVALLQALACVHARGYVHLDVHPDNVMVASVEDAATLKLVDFGSAQAFTAPGEYYGAARGGKWVYMAAEQFDPKWLRRRGAPPPPGENPDWVHLTPSTDVFAAAAVCVHMLTGSAPFTPPGGGKVRAQAVANHDLRRPAAMRAALQAVKPAVPGGVVDALCGALDPSPALRPSADATIAALQACLE